jgi:ATP-dependent DNA helicase RecQ
MDLPKAKRVIRREGDIACDEILFERLRALRKQLADERKVPAYVIFGDATLRQMARDYPDTLSAMEGIFGMGEKKRAEFGEIFANSRHRLTQRPRLNQTAIGRVPRLFQA